MKCSIWTFAHFLVHAQFHIVILRHTALVYILYSFLHYLTKTIRLCLNERQPHTACSSNSDAKVIIYLLICISIRIYDMKREICGKASLDFVC